MFDPSDSVSCALKGHEDFPSPPVSLELQVTRTITVHQSHTEAELKCLSSCSPADGLSYVWIRNKEKIMKEGSLTQTGSLTSAAAGTITVVLLVLVLLAVFLWIRRDKLFTQQCERRERLDNGAELNVGPGFDSPSSAAGQQDELHYASVSFSQNQGDAVYSNIRGHHQTETEEHEEEVEYSVVRFNSSSES
ncbi:hypothetical protein INR49_018506, partial [Caranx melampygus]